MKAAIYVRVSKSSQEYKRQISDLKKYADDHKIKIIEVVDEKISGSTKNNARNGIQRLFHLAEAGKVDKIIVSEISRLGRNTSEVLKVIEMLTENGVSLYVHNYKLETLKPDGNVNPIAQLILTILAEFSRLEKETLVERINSGLEEARRRGVQLGRPKGSNSSNDTLLKKHKDIVRLVSKELGVREIARLTGKSVNTVRKVKELCKQ